MAGFQGGYKIDITLVIDATGSMGPIIERIKENPLFFGDEIKEKLQLCGKFVGALRMRVIDFADFRSEGFEAIHASEFYSIPEEQDRFINQVRGIQYDGRGLDDPENGLEALWVAMNSDWVDLSEYRKGYHIIILITDAYPLNLGERTGCMGYDPDDYPVNIQEMEVIWNERAAQGDGHTKLSPNNKRLFLFAPKGKDKAGHSWDNVASWELALYTPIDYVNDLRDMEHAIECFIAEIVRS